MPGIVVNEPLNPTNWEPDQQQAVYDALVDILEIPPAGTPPADMTDDELQAALIAIGRSGQHSGEIMPCPE